MNVQDIEQKLGTHADLVDIEATATKFIIRMKKKEPKDVWQAIADAIKRLGGKWVYGKDSHGEIPFVKRAEVTPFVKPDAHGRVQKALELINEAGRLLTEEMK